jgi:3-carboxy-cis,cis-muconate cycloisomerase
LAASEPIALLDALFTTDAMREVFSDRHQLQRMLDFEAALARALARIGIAPASVVAAIESQCRASAFDIDSLARSAALSGNVAIPLVKALTELVAKSDAEASAFVHWGATSQDAIDTALVMQSREALELIDADLAHLADALAALAEAHKFTLVAGRTWLQQGPPVTLGLKVAGWLEAIERHRQRLHGTREQLSFLQFGGAVGTLAAVADRGPELAAALARELKLALPDIPWHSHRDRLAEAAASLGLLVGSLGKIARDISLMSQTEIDEVVEPSAPGRGGSSTMPHKRNPVGSAVILAAALRVPQLVSTVLASMVQEHERGLGGWHAEWETLPEIFRLAAGALAHMKAIVDGLEVHPEKMLRNLNQTRGLILAEAVAFALRKPLGREKSHQIVEEAARRAVQEGRDFAGLLMEHPDVRSHLSAAELARLLDPASYLGAAIEMTEKVLSARATRAPVAPGSAGKRPKK